jgi:hypothetical protein
MFQDMRVVHMYCVCQMNFYEFKELADKALGYESHENWLMHHWLDFSQKGVTFLFGWGKEGEKIFDLIQEKIKEIGYKG